MAITNRDRLEAAKSALKYGVDLKNLYREDDVKHYDIFKSDESPIPGVKYGDWKPDSTKGGWIRTAQAGDVTIYDGWDGPPGSSPANPFPDETPNDGSTIFGKPNQLNLLGSIAAPVAGAALLPFAISGAIEKTFPGTPLGLPAKKMGEAIIAGVNASYKAKKKQAGTI
jgi:hypothetical protein